LFNQYEAMRRGGVTWIALDSQLSVWYNTSINQIGVDGRSVSAAKMIFHMDGFCCCGLSAQTDRIGGQ